MKIRKGFVTNSSSSSFILGFKSEDTIKEELEKENLGEYFERILDDIKKETKLTKEDVLGGYGKEIYYHTLWEVENSLNIRHDQRAENRKTEAFQAKLNNVISKKVSELAEKLEGYSVFVEPIYSDESGEGVLEHYIVPNMNCCLAVISHH